MTRRKFLKLFGTTGIVLLTGIPAVASVCPTPNPPKLNVEAISRAVQTNVRFPDGGTLLLSGVRATRNGDGWDIEWNFVSGDVIKDRNGVPIYRTIDAGDLQEVLPSRTNTLKVTIDCEPMQVVRTHGVYGFALPKLS